MGAIAPDSEPLVSRLASDPCLGEIVALYAAEMPERIDTLESHFIARDWSGLAVCAHQLKGSAGSHGYREITPLAAALECAVRADRGEAEITQAFDALLQLCRRVR